MHFSEKEEIVAGQLIKVMILSKWKVGDKERQ